MTSGIDDPLMIPWQNQPPLCRLHLAVSQMKPQQR